MTDDIYQAAIKELARAAHGAGRINAPSASARLDNPLCGDRVTLDLAIEDGLIRAVGHETRGCLLCRAAASLLARAAPGLAPARLLAAQAGIAALLQGDGDVPLPWPELAIFTPARAHRSRHGCVLLAFRAAAAALASLDNPISG